MASNVAGTHTDTALHPTDTIYIDWAVLNSGTVGTSVTFYTGIYVDGSPRASWTTAPPLNPNFYTYVQDYSLGKLSAGTHTIRIVTDLTSVITETNESDNSYTKTISVQ